RNLVGEGRFIEIYAKASLDTCEKRDPKGMYKKVRAGIIKEFTGISAPYEEPLNPELIIDTDKESIEDSTNKVIDKIEELGLLRY
ncbi:MAG: adenylyl-sulfate kinase, partial [Thermoplasmatales archaeon]|nr:adenylyl-sulfate kinase [Thermoplasmatales archaeon]